MNSLDKWLTLTFYRRAEANVLHVSERQKLEVLQREEKTSGQKLSGLEEKYNEHLEKKKSLEEEAVKLTDRKDELEGRVSSLQTDLRTGKQDLERAQSERERISWVSLTIVLCDGSYLGSH